MENYPDKPVSGIFFIKPVVMINHETKTSDILYAKRLVKGDKYDTWFSNDFNRDINLEVPVAGQITDDDTIVALMDHGFKKQVIDEFDPMYVIFIKKENYSLMKTEV
ncbi:MAG: hypothetical protein PHD33_07160 [Atribacterota bacterium]|nr:hypothetical protein [Atribacterota bacterium]